MSWNGPDWDWDDENEQEALDQQRRLQEEINAQQNAIAQSMQQMGQQAINISGSQVVQGSLSGTINLDQGSGSGSGGTLQGSAVSFIIDDRAFYGYNSHYSFSRASKPRPNPDAENFFQGLYYFIPTLVKELVVSEILYNQILSYMGYTKETDVEKYSKELTYNNPYGSILIKNEKFQFSLDKYLEEGPAKEV